MTRLLTEQQRRILEYLRHAATQPTARQVGDQAELGVWSWSAQHGAAPGHRLGYDAANGALRRLEHHGYAVSGPGRPARWDITDAGRAALVEQMASDS